MTTLIRIADRVLNRPLLITPDKAEVIMSVLAGRIGVEAAAPDASRFFGSSVEEDENGRLKGLPYKRTENGVAVISIVGSLVNRGAWVGASSGLVSYEGIQHQLRQAAADPKASAIVLDIQSPGGEAVGAFETAALVREIRSRKPVTAVVNGMAASAGYAIASGATRIVSIDTGISGSIGVVLLHADYSVALHEAGIKPTLIFAGKHKVDGNPFAPLPDSVKADLQGEVQAFYDKFLETVAAGRGSRLTVEGARNTGARTFIGQSAVDVGLVDEVGSFEAVIASAGPGRAIRASNPSMRSKMTDTKGGPDANESGMFSKAEHDAAVGNARTRGEEAGHKAGKAEGVAEGVKATTDRISAILGDERVKGRERAALDLAMKAPAMSAEDVAAFVAANVGPSAAVTGERAKDSPIGLSVEQPPKTAEQKQADASAGWGKAFASVGAKTR